MYVYAYKILYISIEENSVVIDLFQKERMLLKLVKLKTIFIQPDYNYMFNLCKYTIFTLQSEQLMHNNIIIYSMQIYNI